MATHSTMDGGYGDGAGVRVATVLAVVQSFNAPIVIVIASSVTSNHHPAIHFNHGALSFPIVFQPRGYTVHTVHIQKK